MVGDIWSECIFDTAGNTLPCKEPYSWAGKWMQNLWGFFCIIYLAAYTANLTSSITDSTERVEVDGILDPKVLLPLTCLWDTFFGPPLLLTL